VNDSTIEGNSNLIYDGALKVDNVSMDGNTVSTTNANGDLILNANGTGDLVIEADYLNINERAIIDEFTAGETLVVGQAVTMNTSLTDGEFYRTDADFENLSSSMIGITASSGVNGGAVEIVLQGRITITGVVAGDVYYLAPTPGVITNVAPSASGDFVRVIGYGTATNELYVMPSGTWVEVD
jgi:hypothetical protein